MTNSLTIEYPWCSTPSKGWEYKYIPNNSKNTFTMKKDPRYTLNTTLRQPQQDQPTNLKE